MSKTYYARLQPSGTPARRKRGYVAERYREVGSNRTWTGGVQPPWALVDSATAARLRELRQNPYSDESPPLFQVVTPEERSILDSTEEQARQVEIAHAAGRDIHALARPKAAPADLRRPGPDDPPAPDGPSTPPDAIETDPGLSVSPLQPVKRSRPPGVEGSRSAAIPED